MSCSALIGTLVHSLSFGQLQIIARGALVMEKSSGIIQRLVTLPKEADDAAVRQILGSDVKDIADYGDKLIMPGFVDTHVHAPQYVFSGTGMDLPLLEWLQKYTFPCESKFSDLNFAKLAYGKSVKRHLSYGSTCCSYFATIHTPAAIVLADTCIALGQRAYVGKVSMDRNSPDYYVESTEKGCKEAEDFCRAVLEKTPIGAAFVSESDNRPVPELEGYDFFANPTLLNDPKRTPLVVPVITPRFVPTCTIEMMQQLGRISRKYGLPIQSHLSESKGEMEWVSALHPECKTYADIYRKYGLMHSATYMAHCVHSDNTELEVLTSCGCGISHCASSNFNLCSGVMNVRKHMASGVKMSMGTDVAGGHSPSMLDSIRQAIVASTVTSFNEGKDHKPLSYQEAFHLATMGGAQVLGLDKVIGNFEAGKKVDALVVDCKAADSPFDVFEGEEPLEMFQKFLYLGDNRNIKTIYVDGRKVLHQE